MLHGKDILCFGPGDWWYMNPNCTMHIMRRLARRNRVLYVNPFSTDIPRKITTGFGLRLRRKILSAITCFRKAEPHLYTFTPLFIPLQGHRGTDHVNNATVRLQLFLVLKALRMKPDILWFENLRAADAIEWFPRTKRVFHVSDSFSECPYTDAREALRRREETLTALCDPIICVSQPLYESKRALRRDAVHFLSHGVDFSLFERARCADSVPELEGIPRPIAGYFGTMTAQNDVALLADCAGAAPDISFVLAGQITAGDYAALKRLRNVHFIGQLPYERVPYVAAGFDVSLLWWRMTEWIKNCNPLKFHEYLASGVPIVSVPIPQVVSEGGDLISIATAPDEFLAAIRWELANDTPARREARVTLAKRYDWDNQVETITHLIDGVEATQRMPARCA